jgi:hypothetical protein
VLNTKSSPEKSDKGEHHFSALMLVNLLVLLLWSPSLLGFGAAWRALLAKGVGERPATEDWNAGAIMILGFVPLAIISSLLHFFLPLSGAISVTILVLGYWLLLYERRAVAVMLSLRLVGGAVFVMALVSLFASRPLRHFDTGLYHLQSVNWCTTYPLVRGLANLHERLAFNSLWTPISAIVDYPHFGDKACFPITCLLLFAFGWAVFVALCNWGKRANSLANIFLAACGCFWTWIVIADSSLVVLPSLSSDVPIYFMTFVCVYFLLRFCADACVVDLFQALAVAALSVTVKVSAAPLFVFLVLFSAFCWLRDRSNFSSQMQVWRPLTLTTCALFVLWIGRGVWLSGYLLFPVPFTALTFLPWHLPGPMAKQLVETLKAWARCPGVPPEFVLGNSRWVHGWIERLFDENIFYTILAYGAAGTAMMLASCVVGGRNREITKLWPPVAMLCGGLIYWIVTAPDPRYGYGYLFALACLALAAGIDPFFDDHKRLLRVLVCCSGLVPLITVTDVSHFHFRALPLLGIGPSSARRTNEGTTIYVAEGDQRILDGLLPSTPYFRPSLLTRRNVDGRFVEFALPQAVDTPYYGILRERVRKGVAGP